MLKYLPSKITGPLSSVAASQWPFSQKSKPRLSKRSRHPSTKRQLQSATDWSTNELLDGNELKEWAVNMTLKLKEKPVKN